MREYRIKRFTNKYQLGKYYIQYKTWRWKCHRIPDPSDWYGDDWMGMIESFDTEEEAMVRVAELLKTELEKQQKRLASEKYIRNVSADQVAKILLQDSK